MVVLVTPSKVVGDLVQSICYWWVRISFRCVTPGVNDNRHNLQHYVGAQTGKPPKGTSLQNSTWHKHLLFFQEYTSPIVILDLLNLLICARKESALDK